jgi:hypothetical protein
MDLGRPTSRIGNTNGAGGTAVYSALASTARALRDVAVFYVSALRHARFKFVRSVVVGVLGLGISIGSSGCGNEDLVFPGMALPTVAPTTSPTCVQNGGACTMSSDCCSGNCFSPDGVTLQCQ